MNQCEVCKWKEIHISSRYLDWNTEGLLGQVSHLIHRFKDPKKNKWNVLFPPTPIFTINLPLAPTQRAIWRGTFCQNSITTIGSIRQLIISFIARYCNRSFLSFQSVSSLIWWLSQLRPPYVPLTKTKRGLTTVQPPQAQPSTPNWQVCSCTGQVIVITIFPPKYGIFTLS